jgi:hypothetical protein
MKTFKDFAQKKLIRNKDGVLLGETDWTMKNVFDMLNYLSREIQSVKDKQEATSMQDRLEEWNEEEYKQEKRLLKMCLDYCSHRIKKHDECGITGLVDINLLEKLRKEL